MTTLLGTSRARARALVGFEQHGLFADIAWARACALVGFRS